MTDSGADASRRLAMLEQMIAKGTSDPFAHYARAMELRALGRTDDALAAYDDVIARFPHYVPAYLMAGQVAKELGRADRAREVLRRGIETAEKQGNHHALSEMSALLESL